MSLYLDASVLVASLTEEARTREARQLIAAYDRFDIALSSWTLVETLSGLSKKVRTGDLTSADFEVLSGQVHTLPNSFSRTPVSEEHLLSAMRLVRSLSTGLRAGDALHLAIAADFNLTLATFDKGLEAAAAMVGVSVLQTPA
ncbi:type II toxin-antitoxin system VapC family toxin [Brevundimonas sp. GCM10030266]|uniref:type II toxin-antitoxin system VapC family toxin n=1 Tax=Brevundimonas sp. GCM10030266 TaxID=3273386 RepID=UPI0036243A4D